MAINYTDFDKIWASTSPLTPYSFSDANYKQGWNFVGSTPPARQMWDAFMKNADEKIQYLYHREDVPIGHEYFTFNPNIPQGSLPLFGGEYSRETYADLWAWVQEQTGYLKSEAEWQTLATANNGNVPYYSDGDGSTTFRVPSLKCWVKSANGTVTEVGSYLEAGLPNITGSALPADPTGSSSIPGRNYNGAFSQYSTGTVNTVTSSGSASKTYGLSIDASRSSSIYGNSTTVQPESIVGMWLVKAYGFIQDTGTINEQAYIDDRYNAMKTYVDGKFDFVVDKGAGYIRYDSGLQMCWGSITTKTDGTYANVNFPVPFDSVPTATASASNVTSVATNSVNVQISVSATAIGTRMSIGNSWNSAPTYYIAIGYWK